MSAAELARVLISPPEPGAVTVVQRQEVVLPRPLLVTERNHKAVLGFDDERAFRRLLRLLGVPTMQTAEGVVALVDDVEAAFRERGRPLKGEGKPRPKASTTRSPVDDDDVDLARIGLRRNH